jgi:uncharacterized SAM-binding protein YcdF (DUF218 family)
MAALAMAAVVSAALAAPRLVVTEVPLEAPDALVVLASHEWERIPAAASLAAASPRAAVVLTVPRRFSELSCHLCGERPRWLNRLGVAGDRIVEVALPPEAGTWEEALAVTEAARARGWRRLLIVTSAYHTRRALWSFRRAVHGDRDVGVRSAAGFSRLRPSRWWASVEDAWYLGYELAALAKYALLGRLSR